MSKEKNKKKYRLRRDLEKEKEKVASYSKELKKADDVPISIALGLEISAKTLLKLQAELNGLEPEVDSEKVYKNAIKRATKKTKASDKRSKSN